MRQARANGKAVLRRVRARLPPRRHRPDRTAGGRWLLEGSPRGSEPLPRGERSSPGIAYSCRITARHLPSSRSPARSCWSAWTASASACVLAAKERIGFLSASRVKIESENGSVLIYCIRASGRRGQLTPDNPIAPVWFRSASRRVWFIWTTFGRPPACADGIPFSRYSAALIGHLC